MWEIREGVTKTSNLHQLMPSKDPRSIIHPQHYSPKVLFIAATFTDEHVFAYISSITLQAP